MRIGTLALAAIVLGLSPLANAIEEVGQTYVAPFGTFLHADNDRGVENDLKGFGLAVGFALEDHWDIELAGHRLALDRDGASGQDGNQTGLLLNALNVYNRDGLFAPYLIGGVGLVNTSLSGIPSRNNFEAQGGVGVFTELIPHHLALRTEILYRWDDASSAIGGSFGDVLVNFGIHVPIGGTREAAVLDSDGDGVADSADRCPGTPAGARVDATGCEIDSDGDGVVDRLDKCPDTPKGTRVSGDGCPLDSDGDGVYDGIDQCPNTPRGALVDAVGCPKDTDGDGVYDGIDQCPDTPRGVTVDARGCGNIIDLPGVNFENDSAKLKPGAAEVLDKALATLKDNPKITVEVEGHTDANASDKYNLGLSQRRAETVRGYLIKGGIAASRLTAKGYGKAKPIADNGTPEGRARNRRVDLRITSP